VDCISIGGVTTHKVPIQVEPPTMHLPMSILALGPKSYIAQSHLIQREGANLRFDGQTRFESGRALCLIDSMPAGEAVTVPIAEREDGWFVASTLLLDGRKVNEKDTDLIMVDPDIYALGIPFSFCFAFSPMMS